MTEPYLPADPRERFVEIATAMAAHKRWFQSWSLLRYAATGLLLTPGEPEDLSDRMYLGAEKLKSSAGLFSSMRGDVSYCLVAAMMRHGLDVKAFVETLKETRALFRAEKLPRGETQEAMATLILMSSTGGAPPTTDQVARVAAIWHGMKEHHRFLTHGDDLPAAALLSGEEVDSAEVVARLEELYEGLRAFKFQRGNQLQLATQLLYYAPGEDIELLRRFRDLYKRFQEEGLWMNSGDYDEVAILAFLEDPAELVVSCVLEDRAYLRELMKPKPSKQQGFTLATNTTFLELCTRGDAGGRVVDAMQMSQALQLLAAQQAAAAAGASAAAAGGAAG